MSHRLFALALCAAASLASAQPAPAAWPDGAQSLAADALRAKVAGKVFKAEGGTAKPSRLQYKDDGFVFLNVSTGFRDTGKWRVEGTYLCTDWQTAPNSGCSEVRVAGDVLYVRRSNGELLSLTPQ